MEYIIALSISFFLGVSCLLMPCCAGAIPGVLSSVGWNEQSRRLRIIGRIFIFSFGVILPLTIIGGIFALAGKVLMPFIPSVVAIFSALLILIGILHMFNKTFGFSLVPLPASQELSRGGIFSRGVFYGLTATDCAATIFAPLIAYSLTQLNPIFAVLNFLSFAAGRSSPFFIAAMIPMRQIRAFQDFTSRHAVAFQRLTGIFIIASGILLFVFGNTTP